MDYRLLLKKYINHVGNCEGISFLGDSHVSGAWQSGIDEAEWAELQRLDQEACGEAVHWIHEDIRQPGPDEQVEWRAVGDERYWRKL